jgi:DNA-binding NarL/FixJ family response regulator
LIGHSRPTVLIADDHVIWRRGLRQVLETAFEIVSEAGEGNEAVEQARTCRPDVVVMDIHMPGMDGIAAARQIKEALPETGVVMISASDDDDQIYASIQAGVSGYLVKDDSAEAMCQAVQYAARGEAYLPPLIAKRVLQNMSSLNGTMAALTKRHTPLSSREVTVLRLLAEGLRHKEIARELSISVRTVGNHIASIYNKLGIDDRAKAIVYAIKKGIVRL